MSAGRAVSPIALPDARPSERAATAAALVCPACGTGVFGTSIERFRRYSLHECPACELQFWDPLEMPGVGWYELAYQERDARDLPLEPGHRYFLATPPQTAGKRLLDVGCGMGNFLHAAQRAGYSVTGIEMNRNAVRAARERLGLESVFSVDLEQFVAEHPAEQFDIVTFFEVLEHQAQPRQFLESIRRLVAPGGAIALSVPNRDRWRKAQEVVDCPPNHLTRWNAQALDKFLAANGFEVLAVREEPLRLRRAAEVINSATQTGLAGTVAGEEAPTGADLAAMTAGQAEATLRRYVTSGRHRWAGRLVRAKMAALYPVALVLLPWLRMRGERGLYLYCMARRSGQ